MRLTQNKIESILTKILGEEGRPLIKELVGKENVSEFDLAKRTKTDIKLVRKMLYILYNHNLVGFTRKKDKQKGWYIYYWTLLPESIRFSYQKMKKQQLSTLKQLLEEEEEELFFVCPNNCVRLNFDQSMRFEFHCPECGKLIHQDDGEKRIKELKEKIAQLEKELSKLELQKIKRHEKIRDKLMKKEITQKKATKKLAAKNKKKIVKKVLKKSTKVKVKPKKKTVAKKKVISKKSKIKKK